MIIIIKVANFFFQLQVRSGGFVTFAHQLYPLIAPFWSYGDIGRFRNIFYRVTSNATLLQRAHYQLQELFPSSGNFTPAILFIATWDRLAELFGRGSKVSTYIMTSKQ